MTLMLCDENLDQVIWSNCCDDKATIVKIRKGWNGGSGCSTAVEQTPWEQVFEGSWVRIPPCAGLLFLLFPFVCFHFSPHKKTVECLKSRRCISTNYELNKKIIFLDVVFGAKLA